jgi:hypothetical protein
VIVADQHALASVFSANDVSRDGVGDDARVGVSEVVGDDGAPTVSAEFDRSHKW